MKKRLKKILGIGILVPILFLLIGLNIKPKCVTLDVTDDLLINQDNQKNYALFIITPDVLDRGKQGINGIEYLTDDNQYRNFSWSYDFTNNYLFFRNSDGESLLYENSLKEPLILLISLVNVGQDSVIIDYYLYKIDNRQITEIDSSKNLQYGIGRFSDENIMLYNYNSAFLTGFGGLTISNIDTYRNNPLYYINNYVMNLQFVIDKIYDNGFSVGHTQGYNEGLEDGGAFDESLWFFTPVINGVTSVLSIQLFPNITIGTFLLIPLALGIIGLILVFWRKD